MFPLKYSKGFADIKDSFEDGIALLSIIPWFHAYGILTNIGMCICGSKTVFLPKFEENAFLSALQVRAPRYFNQQQICIILNLIL